MLNSDNSIIVSRLLKHARLPNKWPVKGFPDWYCYTKAHASSPHRLRHFETCNKFREILFNP